MGEMKKGTLIMLIAIVWLTVLCSALLTYVISERNHRPVEYEVYESQNEYLVIGYPRKSNEFRFSRRFNTGGYESSAATFISENEAVLDGSKMFPMEMDFYYRFIFIYKNHL